MRVAISIALIGLTSFACAGRFFFGSPRLLKTDYTISGDSTWSNTLGTNTAQAVATSKATFTLVPGSNRSQLSHAVGCMSYEFDVFFTETVEGEGQPGLVLLSRVVEGSVFGSISTSGGSGTPNSGYLEFDSRIGHGINDSSAATYNVNYPSGAWPLSISMNSGKVYREYPARFEGGWILVKSGKGLRTWKRTIPFMAPEIKAQANAYLTGFFPYKPEVNAKTTMQLKLEID